MLKIFTSELDFSSTITNEIIEYSETCIAKRGFFHFLICGGTSPISIYKCLSTKKIDWSYWHFWICDERCFVKSKLELNYTVIYQNLLKHISYNTTNFHYFDFNENIGHAILNYEKMLTKIESIDFSLLGVGEDGHVASLFPGMNLGLDDNSPNILFNNNSPKYPKNRLTISGKIINNSRQILYLAKGVEKKYIVDKYQRDNTLPFNILKGKENTSLYFLLNK